MHDQRSVQCPECDFAVELRRGDPDDYIPPHRRISYPADIYALWDGGPTAEIEVCSASFRRTGPPPPLPPCPFCGHDISTQVHLMGDPPNARHPMDMVCTQCPDMLCRTPN